MVNNGAADDGTSEGPHPPLHIPCREPTAAEGYGRREGRASLSNSLERSGAVVLNDGSAPPNGDDRGRDGGGSAGGGCPPPEGNARDGEGFDERSPNQNIESGEDRSTLTRRPRLRRQDLGEDMGVSAVEGGATTLRRESVSPPPRGDYRSENLREMFLRNPSYSMDLGGLDPVPENGDITQEPFTSAVDQGLKYYPTSDLGIPQCVLGGGDGENGDDENGDLGASKKPKRGLLSLIKSAKVKGRGADGNGNGDSGRILVNVEDSIARLERDWGRRRPTSDHAGACNTCYLWRMRRGSSLRST